MIKFENVETYGWEAAIRGMRNPMNSWSKSDSCFNNCFNLTCDKCKQVSSNECLSIGPNDHDLMMKLRNAGSDHRKFMRTIMVSVDITAPLYWWKEKSTYRVGVVINSCSTMHKITEKEFTLDNFSHEHLIDEELTAYTQLRYDTPTETLQIVVDQLNKCRKRYLETTDLELKKVWWWQIIQLLPSSYNQKRTVMMNYEVLANIYKSRKNHKLDEWSIGFMNFIKDLPYSELITGEENSNENES